MRRGCVILLAVVCLWLGNAKESQAGVYLNGSLGGNYSLSVSPKSKFEKLGGNFELSLGYELKFIVGVSFEAAVLFDVLKKELLVRPGMRLHFAMFYVRFAAPLAFYFDENADGWNMGALLGLGAKIGVPMTGLSFFGEVNITPYFIKIDTMGLLMPIEMRLGVSYAF